MGYLDIANQAPPKKKSYLDIANSVPEKTVETAQEPIESPAQKAALFSLPTNKFAGDIINTPTITPQDVIQGTLPYKGIKIIKEQFQPQAVEQLSGMVGKGVGNIEEAGRGILPTSISNLGVMGGLRAAQNKPIRDVGLQMLTDPETYMTAGTPMGIEGGLPGATTAIDSRISGLLPKPGQQEIGRKGLSVLKVGRDYLYDEVATPAADIIGKSIRSNPQVAKTLKVKPDTIKLITKHGYDKVANAAKAEEEASQAFSAAMSKKTKIYGDKIDISKTLDKMKSKYDAIKKVDPNNKLKSIIDNLESLQPAKEGFYKDKVPTPTQLKRLFARGEKLSDIGKEVRLSRTELSSLRDQLSNLYKERSFDRSVFEIIDSLYADAESAGLEGIQSARKLFKESKEFSKAATDIAKIEKLDEARVLTDLNSVRQDPTKYKVMVDKYAQYVGKDTAEKIFKEALAVRRGMSIIKRSAALGGIGLLGKMGLDIAR